MIKIITKINLKIRKVRRIKRNKIRIKNKNQDSKDSRRKNLSIDI